MVANMFPQIFHQYCLNSYATLPQKWVLLHSGVCVIGSGGTISNVCENVLHWNCLWWQNCVKRFLQSIAMRLSGLGYCTIIDHSTVTTHAVQRVVVWETMNWKLWNCFSCVRADVIQQCTWCAGIIFLQSSVIIQDCQRLPTLFTTELGSAINMSYYTYCTECGVCVVMQNSFQCVCCNAE